jgi:hypothetical protein
MNAPTTHGVDRTPGRRRTLGRRRVLGATVLTLAAARLGLLRASQAEPREPRHLAALRRATEWHESPPSIAGLTGQVVLVQFGTYTCINWLRTLPWMRAWARSYRQRFAVIGVHTPEFTFERRLENVQRALRTLALPFPVAVDSDQAIWRAFDNHYWPALYLLDVRGTLRAHHFGEGDYERTERTIRELLMEAGVQADAADAPVAGQGIEVQADWPRLKSPEMYLAYPRAEHFAAPGAATPGRRPHALPARLGVNQWALAGVWTMAEEHTQLNQAPGRLVCRFQARDVHLVMGPRRVDVPLRFRVSLDGQRPGPARGLDVDADGGGTVVDQRLHQLIRQPGPIAARTVAIEFLDAGAEIFAFTFG